MLDIYVQMDSTDTNHFEPYLNFSKDGNYTGKVYTTNPYGDQVPNYFIYNREDKAGVIKSILLEYTTVPKNLLTIRLIFSTSFFM